MRGEAHVVCLDSSFVAVDGVVRSLARGVFEPWMLFSRRGLYCAVMGCMWAGDPLCRRPVWTRRPDGAYLELTPRLCRRLGMVMS